MRTVSGTAQSMTTRSCSARMWTGAPWNTRCRESADHSLGSRGSMCSRSPPGTKPAEPVRQRLPEPAHRGEVKTAGGGAGEIVEVESGGHAKRHECTIWLAGASEQGGVNRRRQRAAVRRSWLVERQIGLAATPVRPRSGTR